MVKPAASRSVVVKISHTISGGRGHSRRCIFCLATLSNRIVSTFFFVLVLSFLFSKRSKNYSTCFHFFSFFHSLFFSSTPPPPKAMRFPTDFMRISFPPLPECYCHITSNAMAQKRAAFRNV